MRNKTLITFGSITVGCGLIIFILIAAAKEQLNHANGFNRKWIDNPTLVTSKNFDAPVYRIASIDSSKIYLTGNLHGQIYVWDMNSDIIDTLQIPLPNDNRFLTGYDLTINYPKVNAVAKNYRGILTYEDSDSGFVLKQIVNLETTLITRSAFSSGSSIFLRAFDTSRKYQEFQKIDILTGRLQTRALPFDTKFDAGFSSDGMLLYDSFSSSVLYVQYYQNAFYCMDTSLNLKYIGKTIDTVSSTNVATRKIQNDSAIGSLMPSTPLIPINKTAWVDNGKLYVSSLLQADNEDIKKFLDNTEVDTYSVTDGKYQGSFYIPNIEDKKAVDVRIIGNTVYALYPKKIMKYTL